MTQNGWDGWIHRIGSKATERTACSGNRGETLRKNKRIERVGLWSDKGKWRRLWPTVVGGREGEGGRGGLLEAVHEFYVHHQLHQPLVSGEDGEGKKEGRRQDGRGM
jgi:hypothetical protein